MYHVSRIIILGIGLLGLASLSVSVDAAEEPHSYGSQLKNPDGTWKWTNRLSGETSPYLLLHAHNPVDWYPWGSEALERAKAENKPIFLSVGYSTCYWCHVMERKVFSHPDIADQMNKMFINIKVDREERPDLDDIYMTATQIVTGSGGWPNSVFLTPDLLPFYAGTYFPPEDSIGGRPGFPKVLNAIHDAWVNRKEEVIAQAERITEVIRRATGGGLNSDDDTPLDGKLIASAEKYLRDRYNAAYGGFDSAPKFPSPTNLEFLISSNDDSVLKMVTHTLDMMAYGGIYDQIGGGFHRYSVDAKWLVPHFEKMLYDNGQLAKVYLQTYQLTADPLYRRIADEIFAFIFREMTSPEGGFYSALDAETDAEEGKYYVWTETEIRESIGEADSKLFMKVYGVDKGPNFEGETNILYLPVSIASVAHTENSSEAKILGTIEPLKAKLLKVREKRERPLLDTKIIVSWNGLMIDALAHGYEVLGDARYRDAAEQAADFILTKLKKPDGRLMHTYRDGVVKYDGYLDDYAFFVRGLLSLYQATGERRWLREAKALTDTMLGLFRDDSGGGFFFTLAAQEHLLVRTKKPYDSAIPSGNSVAANNLLNLALLTGDRNYLDQAESTLQSFAGIMAQAPGGFMHMHLALNRYLSTDWTKVEQTNKSKSAQFGLDTKKENGVDLFTLPKDFNNPITPPSEARLVDCSASVASDNPFNVTVQLKVAKGWHINANPPGQEGLIPTTVSVAPDAPVEIVSVNYPKGESVHFDFSDESLAVYTGDITIQVKLKPKPDISREEAFPVQLELRYQACNDTQCLPPATSMIQLKEK